MQNKTIISRLFAAFLLLVSVWSWGQTTLVNYKFEDNLNSETGAIGNPTLTASVTPTYNSGVTGKAASFASSTGRYF